MDKKQLSQLDPNLKAVYDRVMGVANSAPPPPPTASVSPQVAPTPQQPTAPTSPQDPGASTSPVKFVTQELPAIPTEQISPKTPPTPASGPFVQSTGPQTFKPEVLYNPQLGGNSTNPAPLPNSFQTMQSTVPTVPMHATSEHSGSGKMFMILFIVLGVIFFVLYGFFWVQLFNIGIPPFE